MGESMKVYYPLPLVTSQVTERWHMVEGGFDTIVTEPRKKDVVIHTPHGFLTNFASVPRMPFAYLLAGGRGNKPAASHDYLYAEATRPRLWCDRVFESGLETVAVWVGADGKEVVEIEWYQIQAMYFTVRVAGWNYYGKPSKDMPILAHYSDLGIPT